MQKASFYYLLSILLTQFVLSISAGDSVIKRGVVSSDVLIIRAKPASFYERLGQFKRGDVVQVIGKKEDWYEILLPDSVRGWVRTEHLDSEGKVISDLCFISSGSGDSFTPFFRVPPSTTLQKIGFPANGWIQVQPPQGASAWVNNAYVVLDEERRAEEVAAASPVAIPALAVLEKQRASLKEEHAKQQESLQAEQARLEKLRQEAADLQKSMHADSAVVVDLQREAERLQALKEAAEAKAALARVEREKALLIAANEQKKLEAQKEAAEQKAQTVLTEKAKWEAEAQQTAAAIEQARQDAQKQADQARAEAEQLEKERTQAVLIAEEAFQRALEAEEKKRESEARQAATVEAIATLQRGLAEAETRVNQLRLERERMELSTRAEAAKLEAARLEVEQLALEKREMAIRIEQSKKEREEISRQAEEDAKHLAALKEEAEQQARSVSAMQQQKEDKEVVAAAAPTPLPSESGAERLLLTIPVPPATVVEPPSPAVMKTVSASVEIPVIIEEEAKEAAEIEAEAEVGSGAISAVETSPTEDSPAPELAPAPQWSGILLSLRKQASQNASHVLCERKDFTLQPVCYLKSVLLDLAQWENQEVEVSGKEVQIPGWSKPVILVNSIIKK